MRHSTQYLYDINPSEFTSMTYIKAIKYRIAKAKSLLDSLLLPHYSVRDDERINAVFKAIRFNESLLKEVQ
jgi:hypothetical protein